MEQLHSNYIITKSNALISARYSLELTETRIVLSMIALIEPHDEDFCEYELSVKNILALSQTTHKDEYTRVREAVESLASKVIHIKREHGGFLVTNWISSGEYVPKKGIVKLCFDPKLKPYLLGLKQHFTQYPLKYILPIRSSYSIRIYEMLKMELKGKKEGTVSKTVEELRNILDLQGKYKTYKDIKQRIIIPAQKHLEKNTDIGFHIEERKEGRAISTVIFNVYEVKQYARLLGEPADIEEQEQVTVHEPIMSEQFTIKTLEPFRDDRDPEYEHKFLLLKSMGVTSSTASRLANEKTLQVIQEAIEKFKDMEQKKEIKRSKGGLLVTLVEEEASLLSPVDKEKRRLAQEHRAKEAQADYQRGIFAQAHKAYTEYKRNNPQIISQWLDEATNEDYETYFEKYKDSPIQPAPLLPSGELDKVKCRNEQMFQILVLTRQKREEKFYTDFVKKQFGKSVAKINGNYVLTDL